MCESGLLAGVSANQEEVGRRITEVRAAVRQTARTVGECEQLMAL